MIKLKLSEQIEQKHKKYFREKVLIKFDSVPVFYEVDYKTSHISFMNYCRKNGEILSVGKPKDLRFFFDNLPQDSKPLLNANPNCSYNGKKYKYKDFLLYLFGYQEFCDLNQYVSNELLTQENYIQIKSNLKKYWTPYNFVLLSNVRVCPYCNRQYITPLYIHSSLKGVHKLRADLDHFYPKNKYPYFSMSLYNLVPCCKFCNSSLKSIKEFDLNDINPYEENFDDYFKFRLDFSLGIKIYIEKVKASTSLERFLDCFQLEALYNYHKNQAEELVKKRLIYPDSYIEELYKNNEVYFSSKEEIKQIIIGYLSDKQHLNDEVLLKFRRDIAEQLHFIDDSVDKELINKLKNLNKNE